MPQPVPARLHVLMARDSGLAVVIRRGPSRKVCVIGWNRESDTFAVGQWLHGRIYERRCDLSPNGKYLLYFAMNGKWSSEVKGSWTAVSQAPYIKAIGLWPKGDCWNGGGLFLSNRKFWLNDGPCRHETLREAPSLSHESRSPWPAIYGGECPGVYYHRLQRDGWTLDEFTRNGAGGVIANFSRRVNDHWALHKFAHQTLSHPVGKGCYFDEHALHNKRSGEVIAKPDWEWADIDGGRIVWAEAGQLFAGHLGKAELGRIKLLYDFNALAYERIVAPY